MLLYGLHVYTNDGGQVPDGAAGAGGRRVQRKSYSR